MTEQCFKTKYALRQSNIIFLRQRNISNKEDMIMGTMKYKGYTGSVDYSEEDNCLYGEVLGMSHDAITYEGKDVDELRKDFEGAVDA